MLRVDCPVQAVCLLTSLFGHKIALLEIHVAALVTSQRRHAAGRGLSVLPRYGLPAQAVRVPLQRLLEFPSLLVLREKSKA